MNTTADPITLFIVHWNRPAACAATLAAFLEQKVPLRPVIIDNASDDNAYQALQQAVGDRATFVRLGENKGWGPALNVALRNWLDVGTGAFCLISAHDAEPGPGCLKLLMHAAENDSRIGIAFPQYADATVPHLSILHGVRLHLGKVGLEGAVDFVDVPHGTLFLVRRDCLKAIGYFDERYFAYGDEHELGARAVRQQWKVALVWGAVVANPETSTPATWRNYLFARNSLLLVHDYFGRAAACLRALVIFFNVLRFWIRRERGDSSLAVRGRVLAIRDYFAGRYGPPAFE